MERQDDVNQFEIILLTLISIITDSEHEISTKPESPENSLSPQRNISPSLQNDFSRAFVGNIWDFEFSVYSVQGLGLTRSQVHGLTRLVFATLAGVFTGSIAAVEQQIFGVYQSDLLKYWLTRAALPFQKRADRPASKLKKKLSI